MFKRDPRPELEIPADLRALSDAKLDALHQDLERRHIVKKQKLHHRCVDRRCRRLGTCAAGGGRCVCIGVPQMGKRDRKRASQGRLGAA